MNFIVFIIYFPLILIHSRSNGQRLFQQKRPSCRSYVYECIACHFLKQNRSWLDASASCKNDLNYMNRGVKYVSHLVHDEHIFDLWPTLGVDCRLTRSSSLWTAFFWNSTAKDWFRRELANVTRLKRLERSLINADDVIIKKPDVSSPVSNSSELLCGAVVLDETTGKLALEARECDEVASGVLCWLERVRRCLTDVTAVDQTSCTLRSRRVNRRARRPVIPKSTVNTTFHCFKDAGGVNECFDPIHTLPLKCQIGPKFQCYRILPFKTKSHSSWVYVLLGFLVLACFLLIIMSCCLLISGMRGTANVYEAQKCAETGDFKDIQQAMYNLRSEDTKKMQI